MARGEKAMVGKEAGRKGVVDSGHLPACVSVGYGPGQRDLAEHRSARSVEKA